MSFQVPRWPPWSSSGGTSDSDGEARPELEVQALAGSLTQSGMLSSAYQAAPVAHQATAEGSLAPHIGFLGARVAPIRGGSYAAAAQELDQRQVPLVLAHSGFLFGDDGFSARARRSRSGPASSQGVGSARRRSGGGLGRSQSLGLLTGVGRGKRRFSGGRRSQIRWIAVRAPLWTSMSTLESSTAGCRSCRARGGAPSTAVSRDPTEFRDDVGDPPPRVLAHFRVDAVQLVVVHQDRVLQVGCRRWSSSFASPRSWAATA